MPGKKKKSVSVEKQGMRLSGKRAIWSGHISFGLVSVPISLYSTFQERPISFNMLCKTCLSPIKYKRWCEKCGKEVPWQDVLKGYKLAKEEYVIVTEEDLENIPLPTARTILVQEFVSGGGIDPLYFDKNYLILPDSGGEHAFYLLLNAMEALGRVAIAKMVLRNREDLVLLRPYHGVFLLTMLHYPQEIIDVGKFVSGLEPGKESYEKDEEKLAKELIDAMTKELDLQKYKDEYRKALEELVERKASGKPMPKQPKAQEVKSLVEALKRSVEKAK
jgi:DNA end-binding protein Ku